MKPWAKFLLRARRAVKDLKAKHPRVLVATLMVLGMVSVYAMSKANDVTKRVVHVEREGKFQGKRIMGDAQSSVYEAKERNLNKTAIELLNGQKRLHEDMQKLADRVAAVETGQSQTSAVGTSTATITNTGDELSLSKPLGSGFEQPPRAQAPAYESEVIRPVTSAWPNTAGGSRIGLASVQRTPARGPDVVTFPVAAEEAKEELGIVLPVGSYVKAKIIAGTDATTGEPDPVLLQLDYSHVLPNERKIDLSGCFMTAKAQADLSTERVKMKTMKLSCVSQRGLVFERSVNGYVADDTDNKFAVSGPVNSKQDRVAAMAFLASVVEGVGKAVQQAQSTQQTTALGGSQSVMTGNEGKYLAGGAAANAAGMVAQWYLKQAESLLPSITVGSGRDVWVVVLDNVNLPSNHFNKGDSDDAREAYVSRILD